MKCKPPSRFRAAGILSWAEASTRGPAFTNKKPRHRGLRAKGIKYEARVHAKLESLFGEAYIPSQWFRFGSDLSQVRWCQPDGLLFDVKRGVLTVVEIKWSHTSDAWWQLRHLYGPVMQFIFPTFQVQILEICQWYDCATAFPEEVVLISNPGRCQFGHYNLHIYRPKRNDP